jgi:hypothetical protein
MRPLLLTCAILAFAGFVRGQSEEPSDYSIATVKFALRLQSTGQHVVFSPTLRQIAKLGDGVSIALLKIFGEQDLANPDTVMSFLPIIRDAFQQPQSIALDADKEPKITLFVLSYLKSRVSDPATLKEIQETVEFVQTKTAK